MSTTAGDEDKLFSNKLTSAATNDTSVQRTDDLQINNIVHTSV